MYSFLFLRETNPMKKIASLFLATAACLFTLSMTGCGTGENTVIEAPATTADDEPAAMDGMSDEEYDAAMDADMNG